LRLVFDYARFMNIINEAALPGVGRKFWIESTGGGRISIIAYKSGEYEIYLTPRGAEFPTSAVRLTSEEARALATAFPAGSGPAEPSSMPDITCLVVPATSPLLGVDAGSLTCGAAFVMAVSPVSESTVSPSGGHPLHAADILYLTGPPVDREALARKIRHHD